MAIIIVCKSNAGLFQTHCNTKMLTNVAVLFQRAYCNNIEVVYNVIVSVCKLVAILKVQLNVSIIFQFRFSNVYNLFTILNFNCNNVQT